MAKQSRIRLKPGESIGAAAAEDDLRYLNDCFVGLPLLENLRDVTSHQCLLLGRTGSGKSAILLHMEQKWLNVTRVIPKDVSFQYIANSTMLKALREIGVDLHIFYEYLWKHILCIHVIRECLGVKTEDSFKMMFNRVEAFVRRDQRKTAVIEYLERHHDHFWIDADEISREVTRTITEKLSASMGLDVEILKGQLEDAGSWKEEERRVMKTRAQSVVNTLQMRELNETISALSELMAERKAAHYVVIDDLDENWGGGEDTQYPMIRSLIGTLKTFGRIRNLKIIIAIREDLFEAMKRETTETHFQSEKLEGKVCRIRWSPLQLMEVVELRLNLLFKSRFTKKKVCIEDVFPDRVWEEKIRDFLTTHTLRRPRDVIALVNKILENATEVPIAARVITGIEASYARDRLTYLAQEWRSCHPHLRLYISSLAGKERPKRLEDFDEARLTELIIEVASSDRKSIDDVERLARLAFDERNKDDRLRKLATALVCCLYKVGALAVKLGAEQPFKYCYDEDVTLCESELTPECRFRVHPMLDSALGGNSRLSRAA